MSSFSRIDGRLFLWRYLAVFWTYKKFSCMLHFLMKALWHLSTRSFNFGASRRARSLVKIFSKLCISEIGLKSCSVSAPCFFGMRTMMALLTLARPLLSMRNNWFSAANKSSLITSQHRLKKPPEKPSGPGALSAGICRWLALFPPS